MKLHACLALAGLIFVSLGDLTAQEDSYRKARLKMVEDRVEREGIRNEVVLKTIREVPRHLFVAEKYRSYAYEEKIIDIGYKQTLSTAYIVAYMTEAIDPQPTDRVLEIGTGSGYQAAVLAKIVKEVYTIEIVEPLGNEARDRLKTMGYKNVWVKTGDGFKGWPDHAPFDKIIVTCSPEKVPQPLADQLKEGGKMIIPLGERYLQAFYLFEKKDGRLVKTKLLPTLFVPMTGKAEEERKTKTDYSRPHVANGNFESSTDGVPDGWFYVRQGALEHSKASQAKTFITFSNREPGRDAHAIQGVGMDGTKAHAIRISFQAKGEEVLPDASEPPGLLVLFFDSNNKRVGAKIVGSRLRGTFGWTKVSEEVDVPRETHMAMVQIGLRGGTGKLSVNDIHLARIR